MRLFTYGAAGALLSIDKNAVATMRYRGLLTPWVLEQSSSDLADYMARRSVQALVSRFEEAQILLGTRQTYPLDGHSVPGVLQLIPAAIVAPERDHADMVEYALAMAQFGLIRRAFTDYAPALAWATLKGRALEPFPPELPYFRETL